MERFRDLYRIPSARLRGYDYTTPGAYFVTICTNHRTCWFGEVRHGIMGLSPAGCIAHRCWSALPDHFAHVQLDAFMVMPNHVHGIIILSPPADSAPGKAPPGETSPGKTSSGGTYPVETLHATSLQPQNPNDSPNPNDSANPGGRRKPGGGDQTMAAISPLAGSLAVVVRSYKSAVTRQVRRDLEPAFAWQPRYYDHVIRHAAAGRRIRSYILDNPLKWEQDRYHRER